jgi:3-deoxy-manno-octulosonate cytidylyltransferase (CMP-KDO synthetase)
MKALAIIPARFASSRFPGKPLSMIGDKPLIIHAYENAHLSGLFDRTVVATDDEQIAACVSSYGGEVLMTSPEHLNGTTRCAEALSLLKEDFDVVLNAQGDEPFMDHTIFSALLNLFANKDTQIGTLAQKINSTEELLDPKNAKIALNEYNQALFFSRSPIPFIRGHEVSEWLNLATFWNHVGLYAFRSAVLAEIALLPPGRLEMLESLEQLRWLEYGYKIYVAETKEVFIGVDTPADLEAANIWYKNHLIPDKL